MKEVFDVFFVTGTVLAVRFVRLVRLRGLEKFVRLEMLLSVIGC